MTAQREHALLSASAAERWLHCTPSARLEENQPDTQSAYAVEGTLAHEVAELVLRKRILDPDNAAKHAAALRKIAKDPMYSKDMLTHANTYVDFISEVIHSYDTPVHIVSEQRVDYGHIAPEGFGTSDCIISSSTELHIVDYKYGTGVPVDAEYNPQMRLYALGALKRYEITGVVKTVSMTIVQPRINSIITDEMGAEELKAWGEEIKPVAEKAFAGAGELTPDPEQPGWCRFCRVRATCPARSRKYSALEVFQPKLMTHEELGAALTKAKGLSAWLKDLEEYALAETLNGNEVPGWKAVEGISRRAFTDTDGAFKTLIEAGYEEALLYKRTPISLAETEKLLKKNAFDELLGAFVVKPQGKPTLVPESDKRQAYQAAYDLAKIFSE